MANLRYLGARLVLVMPADPPKPTHVLFDEWHSESWSCSREQATKMQPEDPVGSSYQRAADLLTARDFQVERNTSEPLSLSRLRNFDVLVLPHPCDPRWERTTSNHSPALSPGELDAVHAWIRAGGGLLVITEYEHDKYGDNLNALLEPAGIRLENGKVFDRAACVNENPEWFIATPSGRAATSLGHLANRAVFYRAGWCHVQGEASIEWQAGDRAHPPHAGVIATARMGLGRIAVVTDSVLFGDERIGEHDHAQLWLNLLYWLATPRHRDGSGSAAPLVVEDRSWWLPLKSAVNQLRLLQDPDGSVPADLHSECLALVAETCHQVSRIAARFPAQAEYFESLQRDFAAWQSDGFARPDFGSSLAAFKPQDHRADHREILTIFPLYTPNASSDIRFEAIHFRSPWPDWLAGLEQRRFHNERFVPGHLIDFTDGYASECAVLFPEMVSLRQRSTNQFATIFCDREAGRLQKAALAAAEVVKLALPPQLECWIHSRPLIEQTVALWDLIHDTSHGMGELPFDPFLIRQRAPFWMYALEELRVDLRSYSEARQLEADGFPFAGYVTYAILLDRLFRFPITGTRRRNYDALSGQLLFAFLHQRDALVWSDNQLSIQWDRLDGEIGVLRDELRTLYKLGSDWSKMSFWLAAHDLIARYVRPNVGSKWRGDTRSITDEADLKHWIEQVLPDEFPLGTFHLNLQKRIAQAAAKGAESA